ncbi:ATP-binding cassette domain-containing protein [Acerihabitans sp. KWT182]|uniref:ATP-binding cassette domain-containing protein n=1 Tax=Acerihabitans sp. KWT182 TaxID=3157919 RepID=A0AAU7QER2_9GAMM
MTFSKRQAIEVARACLAPVLLRGVAQPLILLDEPTSALDRRDEEIFFRLMRRVKSAGSLLFVSHRLSEVMNHADIICVLKDGRLVATLSPDGTDENDLHRLMVGRERSADHYYQQRQGNAEGNPVRLEARGLGLAGAFHDVSLQVRAGEVLGIGGLLDSGKSALGKAVAGITPPDHGEVRLEGRLARRPDIRRFIRQGLGYIPAERLTDGLIARFSVAWNFSLAGGAATCSPIGWDCGAAAANSGKRSAISNSCEYAPPPPVWRVHGSPAAISKRWCWRAGFAAAPGCWCWTIRPAGWTPARKRRSTASSVNSPRRAWPLC